jgi:hypothetical protein
MHVLAKAVQTEQHKTSTVLREFLFPNKRGERIKPDNTKKKVTPASSGSPARNSGGKKFPLAW